MEELQPIYARYLQNKATAEEIDFLVACFKDPAYRKTVEEMVDHYLNLNEKTGPDQLSELEINATVRDIQSALRQQIASEATLPPRIHPPQWIKRIAAVLLIASVGTGLFYRKNIINALSPVHLQYARTQNGERKIITLADGSKIWLSPSSSLEFPAQFNSQLREVKLEGEAFFEVAKDKQHPFIIHSGKMDTKVVGTSFMIRAYKEQTTSAVTVVTGIVQVSLAPTPGKTPEAIRLNPKQRGIFDRNKETLISENYPAADQMLRRKDGILNYDGATVQEVVADLARYYNLPIRIEHPRKNCLCYGEFNTNKSINITLEQLAAAISAQVIQQDNQYIIKGGCEE